jgi:hypothetical protein
VWQLPPDPEEHTMSDKSPRQSSSKKAEKSLKEKRADKKSAAADKSFLPEDAPKRAHK